MDDKAFRSYQKILIAIPVIGFVVCVAVWVRDGEAPTGLIRIHFLVCCIIVIFSTLRNRRKVAEIRRAAQAEAEEPKDDSPPS